MIRIIRSSDDYGNEKVYFTEDFNTPAEELLYLSDTMLIRTDTILDIELPDCFPTERTLIVEL